MGGVGIWGGLLCVVVRYLKFLKPPLESVNALLKQPVAHLEYLNRNPKVLQSPLKSEAGGIFEASFYSNLSHS